MRKLIILAITGAMLALFAVPASAQGPPCVPTAKGNGAATCTANMHNATFFLPGPPPCSGLIEGDTLLTGNAIAHVTISPDGNEFWATETLEGTFATPVGSSPPLATGHATLWFGIEFNQQNQVIHGTVNGNGTGPNGRFGFHENFDMTTNANGKVTAFHDHYHC